MKSIFKKLGSVALYSLVIYGGLNAINTALLPSEYKKLVALGFKKIKTFHQRHDEKEVTEEEKKFATNALREKLRNDRARAEQIQKNIEAFEKKNNSSIQKKAAKHKGLQELNEINANPLSDNPNSNSSTETKSNKDDNFDEMINKVNESFVKPAAPLVPDEQRTPEIEIIINECIISSNDYDGLSVIINQKITDKVDNLNQAVSETKLTGDFSKVEQALAELKNLSLDQKNESFNVGKNSDLQSVRDSVRGTLVGNGLSKTEATKLSKNFSDIRKELSEKLFGKSNNNSNALKNNEEPIYAQVNKKKAGQAASPEEPIYAQVAKKVSAKIDQLNEVTSAINRKIDRINKIASAGKGVGGFGGAGRSASPEPIYATIDFDEANQAGFPLRRSTAVNDLSKVGLSREQELTRRIGDLNQAVSEAKTGHFDKLEQKIDELKDSTKKNALNLWIESAKQVPTSLQAKLDNYATNSHTRINSNVKSGTINEKATGMLTQKNPEWLKLVNDKIVAHNLGSTPLSEYDKIGFNQKNMKDYSDSFKFSTKLNNAVKDIKSNFVQFLTNAFSQGSYNLMKANVEHGVKNTTKSGFQKS
ncbi:hypothetical protein VN0498_07510 [Helicobacter pylori]